MYKKTLLSLAVASSLGLTGCLDDADSGARNANPQYEINNPDFTGKIWPVFNGLTQEFPVPNDILFALETAGDGTFVDGDPTNPVTSGIGFMDGNSVASAFDIKVSGSLDPNQDLDARSFVVAGSSIVPNPDQNVFLLPLEYPGKDPLAGAEGEIPSFAEAIRYQIGTTLAQTPGQEATGGAILSGLASPTARAEIISLDGGVNNVIRINPLTPLEPKTQYLVIVTSDVADANGENLVGSPQYQNYSDTEQPLGNPALQPFRDAIVSWEQLANGYFGFMQQVYDTAGAPFTAPTDEDIVFTMTFTTTSVDDVLQANAAPRIFFEQSARTDARKAAITDLISGDYNLTGQAIESQEPADLGINARIYQLLTDPSAEFELFDSELAGILSDANAAGSTLTFSDVAIDADDELDSTLAFALQTAASTAAIDVKGNAIAGQSVAAEGGFVSSLGALEAPAPRTVNFFDPDKDPATEVNEALVAPAKISEGEITLPYFLEVPADSADGSVIKTTSWQSNQAALLQEPPEAAGLPPVVAPSDLVTYRFPFAGETQETTVPVTVTYPDEATVSALSGGAITKPADGWPVIIFQHGITVDRSATLPLANAMAFACFDASTTPPSPRGDRDCFATIAIDQPLHGVVPNGSVVPGLTMIRDQNGQVVSGASPEATERHFNFTANAELNPVPMAAVPDGLESSGSLFINLTNFVNSRDNLRQGVVDLLNLNASIEGMDIDGVANGPDLDPNRVYFIGHSLGGVNGLPFVSVNNSVAGDAGTVSENLPKIQAAAILNSGGGITKLLENSPDTNFGAAAILPGLAVASEGVLVQGSSALETYFQVLQGLLDSVDPVTFGASLSDSDTDLLFTEIVGDGSDNLRDQTIPNAADADLFDQGPLMLTLPNGFVIDSLPAPLAGTEPMVAEAGATATAEGNLPAITRFTAGSHGTPVSADNPAVFQEMVDQISELFSNGTVSVTNTSVVEAPQAN